jgi:hypothetical protein
MSLESFSVTGNHILDPSGCRQGFCLAIKAYELEFAFENLVDEIDHNGEYSQSAQKPDGVPEECYDYDCKNQQKQVLNASLNSHVLNDVTICNKTVWFNHSKKTTTTINRISLIRASLS